MMIETTVKLMLDTRANCQKRDKTYPIKIRLRHKGQNEPISLGSEFSVKINDWNDKSDEVRASAENGTRLRVKCNDKLKIAEKVIETKEDTLESFSSEQLADLIRTALKDPGDISSLEDGTDQKSSKYITLREWCNTLAERQGKRKKWKTKNWYTDGVDSLLAFHGSEDLQIRHISVALLEEFKADYEGRGLKAGGLNTRLRALRSVLNKAVKEGKMKAEINPFMIFNPTNSKVQIPSGKPKKRAVDAEIVSAFKKLYRGEQVGKVTLKKGGSDWHCVAEGLFMWETWAMNFIDFVKLKVKDVLSNELLDYSRSKNGSEVKAPISALAMEIASYYAEGKEPNEYLFRYRWDDSEKAFKRYEQQRKRWNARMTSLAGKMGYENVEITPYVLRHSFATHLNKNGVTRDFIGEMFGHTDGRSIGTYIAKKDVQVLAEKANAALQSI